MKLNNYTHPDESLQKIKLETLTNEKLVRLAKDIRGSWNCIQNGLWILEGRG